MYTISNTYVVGLVARYKGLAVMTFKIAAVVSRLMHQQMHTSCWLGDMLNATTVYTSFAGGMQCSVGINQIQSSICRKQTKNCYCHKALAKVLEVSPMHI